MGGRDSRNRDLVELHRQADGVDAHSRRHRNAVPSVLTQQPDMLSPAAKLCTLGRYGLLACRLRGSPRWCPADS